MHKFGNATPDLLDFVYSTEPMCHAAPGEYLDFSVLNVHEQITQKIVVEKKKEPVTQMSLTIEIAGTWFELSIIEARASVDCEDAEITKLNVYNQDTEEECILCNQEEIEAITDRIPRHELLHLYSEYFFI